MHNRNLQIVYHLFEHHRGQKLPMNQIHKNDKSVRYGCKLSDWQRKMFSEGVKQKFRLSQPVSRVMILDLFPEANFTKIDFGFLLNNRFQTDVYNCPLQNLKLSQKTLADWITTSNSSAPFTLAEKVWLLEEFYSNKDILLSKFSEERHNRRHFQCTQCRPVAELSCCGFAMWQDSALKKREVS